MRGAIIGTVQVTQIVTESDSPWFGGPSGLVLADPATVDPIPAIGALGYFRWQRAGTLPGLRPWMKDYGRPNGDDSTLDLFPDLGQSF